MGCPLPVLESLFCLLDLAKHPTRAAVRAERAALAFLAPAKRKFAAGGLLLVFADDVALTALCGLGRANESLATAGFIAFTSVFTVDCAGA